jgi:hypothetical protein
MVLLDSSSNARADGRGAIYGGVRRTSTFVDLR